MAQKRVKMYPSHHRRCSHRGHGWQECPAMLPRWSGHTKDDACLWRLKKADCDGARDLERSESCPRKQRAGLLETIASVVRKQAARPAEMARRSWQYKGPFHPSSPTLCPFRRVIDGSDWERLKFLAFLCRDSAVPSLDRLLLCAATYCSVLPSTDGARNS